MAKTLAIVVGINNYRDEALQSLKYAKRDAELMYEFLKIQAKFTEVYLFSEDSPKFNHYSTHPFRSSLRKFLRERFEDSPFQKEDRLWFFFSGHGTRYEDRDYLFTEDSDPDDPVETAIPLNWITERLIGSGAGNIVLILDACRNDMRRKGGSGFGQEIQGGVTTIFSCQPKESSWEIDDPIGKGAFTHILLETFDILLEIFLNQTIENYLATQQTETYLQQRVFELNQQHNIPRQTPHIQISQTGKAEKYPGCISDWDSAPDVEPFYGREQELEKLRQWISIDRSRLVVLYGMGGIGKTSLTVKIAQELEKEFDVLVWRSLKQTPSLAELVIGIEESINPGYISHPKTTVEENINRLINDLRDRRCLIILDDLESILEAETMAGQYQQEYSQYGELIQRIASEKDTQSCLIIVSNEKVSDLVALESTKVHSLPIEGSPEIARQIITSQGLEESDSWNTIIANYGSHPLALKIVINMIKDLYDGQVEDFANGNQGTAYFTFHHLMDQQFARLSSTERDLMYTLAFLQRPVSIAELYIDSWLNLPQSELIEVMTSLRGRSLLERNQTNFSLQPMIWRHTVEQIIAGVTNDIISFMRFPEIDYLTTLKTYPWQMDGEEDNRLLFLIHRYFKAKPLAKALPNILKTLENNYASQSGYAIDNLRVLLKRLDY